MIRATERLRIRQISTRGVSSESFAGLVLRIAACAIWDFRHRGSAGDVQTYGQRDRLTLGLTFTDERHHYKEGVEEKEGEHHDFIPFEAIRQAVRQVATGGHSEPAVTLAPSVTS